MSAIIEFADIEDLDNVRMADRLERTAFFIEELQRERVGELVQCFYRDFAIHRGRVVRPVDDTHAAFTELCRDLVAPRDLIHDDTFRPAERGKAKLLPARSSSATRVPLAAKPRWNLAHSSVNPDSATSHKVHSRAGQALHPATLLTLS